MVLDRAIGVVGGRVYSFDPAGKRRPAGTLTNSHTMSPLRGRMIEDMTLAGLALVRL